MGNETINVIMVGVGGQGIILASEVMTEVAMNAGYDVRKSEVHGMAQRGGSVSSHVRFGDNVKSPLIERGYADYMVAFEKVEGLRTCDMLKKNATIIMNDVEIVPTTVSIGLGEYPKDVTERITGLGFNLRVVDAFHLAEKAGTFKAANVVLLGTLASLLSIKKSPFNFFTLSDIIFRPIPRPAYLSTTSEVEKYFNKTAFVNSFFVFFFFFFKYPLSSPIFFTFLRSMPRPSSDILIQTLSLSSEIEI